MQAKREHRDPLASQAMEVLTAARWLADDSVLIFPWTTERGPLGANTLTKLSHEVTPWVAHARHEKQLQVVVP